MHPVLASATRMLISLTSILITVAFLLHNDYVLSNGDFKSFWKPFKQWFTTSSYSPSSAEEGSNSNVRLIRITSDNCECGEIFVSSRIAHFSVRFAPILALRFGTCRESGFTEFIRKEEVRMGPFGRGVVYIFRKMSNGRDNCADAIRWHHIIVDHISQVRDTCHRILLDTVTGILSMGFNRRLT